jgi:hypothetical protein
MTPSTLTPERRRTLHAVVDRILPGTDGPGAADAGVAAAVEGAMAHRAMLRLGGAIEQLLDRLDAEAVAAHATSFAACAPEMRDALLQKLEAEPNPWTQFLFRYLIAFSLEGLLGDPAHGGNRDGLGWTAVGLHADDVRSGMCRASREL